MFINAALVNNFGDTKYLILPKSYKYLVSLVHDNYTVDFFDTNVDPKIINKLNLYQANKLAAYAKRKNASQVQLVQYAQREKLV